MNPPPLPKPKLSPAHYCAWGSIAAPLILIFLVLIIRTVFIPLPHLAAMVLGLLSLILILTGVITGIVGLCGISEHGPRGLLATGIVGLTINAGLVIFGVSVAVTNFAHRQAASRQFSQEMRADSQQMQANAKKAYNSQTGITNMDSKSLDKIQGDMDKAAQTLTGDDALISQAMSHYVANMRSAMQKYSDAAAKLKAASVLSASNLTDKAQIETRRELIRNFIAVNDDFKNTINHSESSIRADLNNLNVSPGKIGKVLSGFDSKFVPRRDLDVQIRECDDRMGQSMLMILDLLEADWGHWRYDKASNKIYFDRATARQSYQETMKAIRLTGQQQVVLQGELVNQQ